MPDPLILTLTLDDAAAAFFEARRRAYYPPEKNRVPAHLTLFHTLPGNDRDAIEDSLADRAAMTAPVPLTVSGLMLMGAGVAYTIDSPALIALRRAIANDLSASLDGRDGQLFRPHVTIQNNVAPSKARELHETLSSFFTPFPATGIGLDLWLLRGRTWEPAGHFSF